MSYTKTTWIDGQTPLNAENLNKLEAGVEAAHNSGNITHNSHVILQKRVRSWGPVFNPETGRVIMTPIVQGFNTK